MATVYWYGGTGNWSDYANHWSNNSGDSPSSNHGAAPGTDDDVVFDTASSASVTYTVTIDAEAYCKDMTVGAPGGVSKYVGIAGNQTLYIFGNLNITASTAGVYFTHTGTLQFAATSGTKTIYTNSNVLMSIVSFNGNGGTFQLTSDLNLYRPDNTNNLLIRTNGIFDANGYSVIIKTSAQNTNLLNSGSAFTGTSSFYNLQLLNETTGTNSFWSSFLLGSNIAVTNIFTVTGHDKDAKILIMSSVKGTARTITAATCASANVSNANFQDITGAGAATWDLSTSAGGSGNCGGNTMQALGDAAFTAADDWYWHSGTGSTNNYLKWYTQSDGAGSQMASTLVPLPQDTLIFDAFSFTAGSQTITQNLPFLGNVDFTGATNTPTFTTSTSSYVFGSITLISGMVLTNSAQQYIIDGRGTQYLDSGGLTWGKSFDINNITGTFTLKSDFTSTSAISITKGIFSCVDGENNYALSVSFLSSNSGAGVTWTFGSATHLITKTSGDALYFISGNTITAGTYTLKMTGALTAHIHLYGGTLTFNNIWVATTNNFELIINDSLTCNDFKIDAGREVNITNSKTLTCTTFTALGTSGSHIVIHNTSSTTHATLAKAGGGVISGCDYIDIQEMTGSPATTWYIGANSTDVGSTCTEIYLLDEPTASGSTSGFFQLF